jgi:hypothetical protein
MAGRGAASSPVDVLVHVEDPGAATLVAGLPAALARRALACHLLAGGSAFRWLAARGERSHPVLPADSAAALLARLRPRVVAVGTAEDTGSLAHRLVDEAQRRGIVTVGLVDSGSNADRRFRGGGRTPLAHAPDWLAVPDESTRDRFVALGHPAARIAVAGNPRHEAILRRARRLARGDRAVRRRRLLPSAPARSRIVVFASEVSAGLDPAGYARTDEYTLTGRGGATERTHVVLEEVLDALAGRRPPAYLVVRLHPKERPEAFAWAGAEVGCLHSGGDPLALLSVADLVLGMTSALLSEAVLLGQPALSILPREREREWMPPMAGSIPIVTRRKDLARALDRFWRDPRSLRPPAVRVRAGALGRLAELLARVGAGGVSPGTGGRTRRRARRTPPRPTSFRP